MEKVKPTANTEAKGTDPVLLYLPYGWEFAIITIKPPKGCNNTENEAVRHSLAQPECPGQRPGAGFSKNTWLCEAKGRIGRSDSKTAPSV